MKEHSALVATLITAAIVAGRLLAISRFDVNTAATILQVSGVGTAVAGTALTLLPFALLLSTCVLSVLLFVDPSLTTLPIRTDVLFCVSAAATLCLASTTLVAFTAVFVMACVALSWRERRAGNVIRVSRVVAESRLLRVQLIALVVVLALAPIVLQRPWLPTQVVALNGGSTLVGYVLGESEGRLALMEDETRTVHFWTRKTSRIEASARRVPRPGAWRVCFQASPSRVQSWACCCGATKCPTTRPARCLVASSDDLQAESTEATPERSGPCAVVSGGCR